MGWTHKLPSQPNLKLILVAKQRILLKKTDFVSWVNSSKNMYYLDELSVRIVDLMLCEVVPKDWAGEVEWLHAVGRKIRPGSMRGPPPASHPASAARPGAPRPLTAILRSFSFPGFLVENHIKSPLATHWFFLPGIWYLNYSLSLLNLFDIKV